MSKSITDQSLTRRGFIGAAAGAGAVMLMEFGAKEAKAVLSPQKMG